MSYPLDFCLQRRRVSLREAALGAATIATGYSDASGRFPDLSLTSRPCARGQEVSVFLSGQSDALQACPAFAPLAASLALRRRNCCLYYFNIQPTQFHSPIRSAAPVRHTGLVRKRQVEWRAAPAGPRLSGEKFCKAINWQPQNITRPLCQDLLMLAQIGRTPLLY